MLEFNKKLAEGYTSNSQIARRFTEHWVAKYLLTPCHGAHFVSYPNNHKSSDYFCKECNAKFELKTKKGRYKKNIRGAEYKTTLTAFVSDCPHFLLMQRNVITGNVMDVIAIPRLCFHQRILRARKPLGPKARRAGWQGCEILLEHIPDELKVYLIKDGELASPPEVQRNWLHAQEQASEIGRKVGEDINYACTCPFLACHHRCPGDYKL